MSPGSASAGVVGRHGDAWKVRVTPPAEGGKANEAVLSLLAQALALPRQDVTLVAGHSARDKVVALAGIDPDETARRLASAAAGVGRDRG